MPLPTLYQSYIHLSRYSKYIPEKNRRETWEETVNRLIDYLDTKIDIDWSVTKNEIKQAILNLDIMSSMRLLMTAGIACERDNVAAYNCSYAEMSGVCKSIDVLTPEMKALGLDDFITINISEPICFDEIMYILLCGTGVGFSCERQYVTSLPIVGQSLNRSIYNPTNLNFPGVSKNELSLFSREENKVYVADSKYGWASALRILIVELYNGNFSIEWDLSKVRAAGEPLKTFGGRASGPEPLHNLFVYFKDIFKKANNRHLTSLEVHGLVCKIAQIVVVGGVRRSALISLSNLSDDRMRHAKSGNWFDSNPEYSLANNSVAYTEKPSAEIFIREMTALIESKSGERGIYNKVAASLQASKWGRRSREISYGTNPCSEIILRNKQFCNLTEVVVRSKDTYNDLKKKVELATILGTIQATLTNFVYLSDEWRKNTEEERLLGVSLTGIMDHPVLSNSLSELPENWWDGVASYKGNYLAVVLETLRDYSREVNKKWANILGIAESAAITCVKPSGTVSQLVDSASGIHPRYSPYYIRTVRMDKKDPLYSFISQYPGIKIENDYTAPDSTAVLNFPIESPEDSVYRDDRSAIEQLELWLVYQRSWCEHKPSITIYVKDDEWFDVIAWVWNHFDEVSGISFLPHTDHTYKQAPYQEIDRETYYRLSELMPKIDFSKMIESRDNTEGSQTLACVGSSCEVP